MDNSFTPKDSTAKESINDDISHHIGLKIRARRIEQGLSQKKLAAAVGVSFQQVQKYEKGANQLNSERLFQIGKALKVPVEFFYEGIKLVGATGSVVREEKKDIPEGTPETPVDNSETIELLRNYYAIESTEERQDILRAIKEAAAQSKKKQE